MVDLSHKQQQALVHELRKSIFDLLRTRKEQRKRPATLGIIEVLKSTGAYHADDLDHLGIPDEHRNIIGSQTAKLVNQKWIEEVGRRKSILPTRNGAKSGIYQLTDLGKSRIAGVGGGDDKGSPSLAHGVGTAASHSGETGLTGPGGGAGVPDSQGQGEASHLVSFRAGTALPDNAGPRNSTEEQRTSKPTVAGSNPAGGSQARGATRRSISEHAGCEDNPRTGGIARRPARTEMPGDKSEVPAAPEQLFEVDPPSAYDPFSEAA